MRKIVSSAFLVCLCGVATAQTFTFECFGGFLTTADANCDICNTQVQSRLFSGLLVRKNGVVSNWIDCPYIVRAQGNNLVFQEIIPNPQSVTISLAGTGFSTLQGFKDSTACMCARQDSSWAAQVLSAGDGAAATDKTVLLSGGGGAVVFREGTNVTLSRTVDTITINATSGGSTFYQTWRDDGTPLTQRPNANFLQSADVNLILADDAGNTETEVSADILPNAVDYAEIQQVSANRLLGNPTGSTANVVEIPLATGLFFAGGNLNVADRDSLNEAWTIDADDADSEVISNQVVKFQGAGINVTDYVPGTNTLIITGTEVDGSVTNELQTLNNTSDATSHTATLSNSGGSVQIVEGTGIALATTGTALDGIVTVTNSAPDQTVTITGGGINVVTGTYPNFTVTGTEVDGSITNEGSLTVGAGAANTSTIISNTSGGTPVTVSGSNTILVTEAGSTITLQADTSLLATVNDINTVASRTDSTFARLPGETYTGKTISSNAYRYGTTGFRTTDTTGVVNIRTRTGKTGEVITMDTTGEGTVYLSLKPPAFDNIPNLQPFNFMTRRYQGVNAPYNPFPNFVWRFGYNQNTDGSRISTAAPAGGIDFEYLYHNASLPKVTEFHIYHIDSLGNTLKFITAANNWNAARGGARLGFQTDLLTFNDKLSSSVWAHNPLTNIWTFADTVGFTFAEPRGFSMSVQNGANSAAINLMDFNGTDTLEMLRQNGVGLKLHQPLILNLGQMYSGQSTDIKIGSATRETDLSLFGDFRLVKSASNNAITMLHTGDLQTWATNSVTHGFVRNDGFMFFKNFGSNDLTTFNLTQTSDAFGSPGLNLNSTSTIKWSNSANWYGTKDIGLARSSTGVLDVTNGSSSLAKLRAAQLRVTTDDGTSTTIWGADADGDFSKITVSTGLNLSGNVLTATGTGTVTGTGASPRIAYWNGASSLTSDVDLQWDGTKIAITGIPAGQTDGISITNTNAGTNDQTQFRLWNDSGTTANDGGYFGLASSGRSSPYANAMFFWLAENGPIAFGQNNAERMRVTGNGLIIGSTANAANKLDVEGAAVIGATYSGTSAASANGLLVEGNVGIGNTSAQRKLHVTGEARITDLVTDTPTQIVGADADGDLDTVGIGAEAELHITSGTLGTNFHTTISPAQLTASATNNWNPTGLSTAWIIRMSGDGDFSWLTGITAPAFHKRLMLVNVGTDAMLLPHECTLSSAANRFSFGRDVVLFPGKMCEILYDVTSARWRLVSQGGLYDDVQHLYANHVFTSPVSGTTADYDFWEITSPTVSGITPVSGRWSGVGVNTGSSSTGLGYVASKDYYVEVNAGTNTATWVYCKAVIKTPASLSDASNDYTLRIGLNNSTGGAGATDGAYFNYNHGLASGQWDCHTTNAGNTSATSSGITVAAATTYVLEVVYRPALAVEFYIDGVRVASSGTFVPSADDMKVLAEIQKSVGTTSREMNVYLLQTSVALVK